MLAEVKRMVWQAARGIHPFRIALILAIAGSGCDGNSTKTIGGAGGSVSPGKPTDAGIPVVVKDASVDAEGPKDAAAPRDASVTDASVSDASVRDASVSDASVTDAGAPDGSLGDAGSDGGTGVSCTNGVRDGSETDVDCGGTCPACVVYKIGAPKIDDNVKNGCESGGEGFICPRFMLFSPEMMKAAADDAKDNSWPAGSFNYGVATIDGKPCCSCWQLAYGTPKTLKASVPTPKPLIIQMFNSAADGNVDVFMGKGGMGVMTQGCPKLYTTYPDTGEPMMGGIRATNLDQCGKGDSLSSDTCISTIDTECKKIQAASAMLTSTTQNSCIQANRIENLYHENWNLRIREVACPTHLTEVTGCVPNDSSTLPKPDPTVKTASQATGSGWEDKPSTTMEDCCKPSCSWSKKTTGMKAGWEAMYTCRKDGTPITN